ncbi:iron complex transport system ATP-binding protein [Caldalkalibacillus uzonensis]|uniref:Iron complex transport system ATP-binding protein n=1 Tax=Caldalkalibacillus uzonensis TaxID=353224 RepID=A0ABU0CTV4_9BACI|nr:ABC transporter ATP-binding protein [Caldalkalibacillus uzonensis]MDQ0338447.1 iron complex transport system ATP-binding protein [Caldalkalibacillus uzonensis]
MVEVREVAKQYGDKWVVDGISVSIPKQKITSLIGPNGAGKSTLLSMMSRLIAKDHGTVLLDQKEISEYKSEELAKRLSILKQSNHIGIRLTVKDLVSFGRFPHSQGRLSAEDKRIVDQAIRYMKLEGLEDQYLDQLSGGQKQRAFIAMILAQDTDYIFLDEPLNNLDLKHAVEMMNMLQRLVCELGKTIVIVLHDINFASCYSDYIVALKNGRVVKEGNKDEIIRPDVLKEIYDMDIAIETFGQHKICVYFA